MSMKISKTLAWVTIILLLSFSGECLAQTELKSGITGTAGGKTESASHKIWSSVGQPVQQGNAGSTNYLLHGNLLALTRDLELPTLSHAPQTSAQEAGSDITIQVTATDNINVESCTLFYREGGDQTFSSTAMTGTDNNYSGTIPGSVVGVKGVEYYVEVEDVNNNSRESGIYSIRVTVGESGITKSSAQPSGSVQNAYRLISLPLDATNKSPANILEGVLGTYNNTLWRLFELKSDQTYAEHPNTGNMIPGRAFWLIVKDAGKTINTGAGNTIKTDETFIYSLHTGWNLVGNPFNFSVPQSNITLQNDAALDIRSYDGNWNDYSGSLAPFQGYAIYTEAATSLIFNPDLTGSAAAQKILNKSLADKEDEWIIGMEAKCQNARDTDTRVITAEKAETEYDVFDRPEPPVIGEYVSVYFPHPEWEKISEKYSTDARPKLEEGDVWEFEIRTNIREKVSLALNGVESVPEEFEIRLVDLKYKLLYDVREKSDFEVIVGTEHPKEMMLLVGNSEFIQEKLIAYNIMPASFTLNQNFPNPFNPTTTIRYGLPMDERVTLKVYNLLGQEVNTLMNNVTMKAGYHLASWDGRNKQGNRVASGMYIYHIHMGKYS